ncbi:MAG: hypothetical protein KGD73_09835 [Candidatus Lokiarchaeota archaeon]|nr:hypothetical protein [Candidatus Lokiarchaeota archaeon]
MTIDSNFNLEDCLTACPFCHFCALPQNPISCNFPDYKICPEYSQKLIKFKDSSKILQ